LGIIRQGLCGTPNTHSSDFISIKPYFYDYQFHDHERVMNMWPNDVKKYQTKGKVNCNIL